MDASIGSLCPIESLPSYLQPLVALSPLRFLTDALKQLTACAPALYPLGLNVGMGCPSITMQRTPEVWTPQPRHAMGAIPLAEDHPHGCRREAALVAGVLARQSRPRMHAAHRPS